MCVGSDAAVGRHADAEPHGLRVDREARLALRAVRGAAADLTLTLRAGRLHAARAFLARDEVVLRAAEILLDQRACVLAAHLAARAVVGLVALEVGVRRR